MTGSYGLSRYRVRLSKRPSVEVFALEQANEALARLRSGQLHGAAVLAPS